MECDYCGEQLSRTEGKMLVLSNGEKMHFCSGKCEKNYKSNRKHGYADKNQG